MNNEIANLLQRTNLIEKIKSGALLSNLVNSWEFKNFKNGLQPYIQELMDDDWKNPALLALIDDLKTEINKQILCEDEYMITESKALAVGTKVALASGAFLTVGLVLGYLLAQEQSKNRENKNKSSVRGRKEPKSLAPNYTPYQLLLVIPANKLPKNLTAGLISNDKVNDLIVNSIRAYCFAEGDKKGKQIMDSVDCSDAPIDFATENRVFIQLSLSAESDIINHRNKLDIRQAIERSSNGKVLQDPLTIKSARSTSESAGFYQI